MLFLLYLTSIQSLSTALLIFFNKKFRQEDFYLSLFFGTIFFHLLYKISILFIYQDANLFEKLHGSFSFLYGPLLYFYMLSVFNKPISTRKICYHCIPFFVGFAFNIIIVFIAVTNPVFPKIIQLSNFIVMLLLMPSFFGYSIYCLRYIRLTQLDASKIFTLKISIVKIIGGVYFSLGILTTLGLIFLALKIEMMINLRFVYYCLMLFIFIYVIHIRFAIFFEIQKLVIELKNEEKYKNYELKSDDMNEIINTIQSYFKTRKSHLDAEFNLDKLSSDLHISKVKITQSLNVELKTNFYQYINSLRVEEAKRLIDKKQDANFVTIGYESGFKNKSTFYKYFKQITGVTPSDYKKVLEEA
jgi:AraC-like DNA-binding protein